MLNKTSCSFVYKISEVGAFGLPNENIICRIGGCWTFGMGKNMQMSLACTLGGGGRERED